MLEQLPILARIEVGDGYGTVVVDDDVWVLNSIDNTVSRIDPETDTDDRIHRGRDGHADITLSSGDLWVTNPAQNRVTRVDGDTDEVVASVPTGLLPQGITEADGDVWVANHRGRPSGSVWRIDSDTQRVVARIPVGDLEYRSGPSWIAAGAGSVWVGVPNLSAVVRIDPATNAVVATIPVPDGGVCGTVVADDEAVWVASGLCGDGALTRIDPLTNTVVARIRSPHWHTRLQWRRGIRVRVDRHGRRSVPDRPGHQPRPQSTRARQATPPSAATWPPVPARCGSTTRARRPS